MLHHRDPVEVMTTLRSAHRLLTDEAERLRQQALSRAGASDELDARYRDLLAVATDLEALAAEIGAGVDPA